MTPMRAIIVDDEPLARERLRGLLEAAPDVQVVAECADGDAAIAAVDTHTPDVMFLDIQMPGPDGFDVLEALGADSVPVVIFVTAYDVHALRAFEVHALDYLLKPFDRERFDVALRRARTHLAGCNRRAGADLQTLLAARSRRACDRLVVRNGGRIHFVSIAEIAWVESAGNYVRLHTAGQTHLVRRTLASVAAQLDVAGFVRVHRSHLVNLTFVSEIQPAFHGDAVVILKDGTELPLSRTHRQHLLSQLNDES